MNKDLMEFMKLTPVCSENLRQCMLYTLELLDELEIRCEGIEYRGGTTFQFKLPLFEKLFDGYFFPLNFSQNIDTREDQIGCPPGGPVDANKKNAKEIIDCLNLYMPRRRETLMDIIKAGNPDNLAIPKGSMEIDYGAIK